MLHLFERSAAFFDMFDELATLAVSSAEHLRKLASGFPESRPEIERIQAVEFQADEVNHKVLDLLNHQFLPPIDADDVHALAGQLDDIIDGVDSMAKRFRTHHVDSVEPIFVAQTDVLARATARVNDAVHHLRTSRRLSDLDPILIELHRLESLGDDNYHAALSKLFDGSYPALYVIKWKELHMLLEQTIDGCEDVGNTLARVVLKGV